MRHLFTVVLLFLAYWATSQSNPAIVTLQVIKGETIKYSLITTDGTIVTPSTALKVGKDNPDRNAFELEFNSTEVGTFSHVIKYKEGSSVFYTTIVLEVEESIITLGQDYDEIQINERSIIDVLSNDQTSANSLEVTDIPYVQNGQAQILGDLIEFTPESGFEGLAYLNYVVEDDMGTRETGFVTINVTSASQNGSNTSSDIILDNYFLQIGETIDIIIPSEITIDDFSVSSKGKLIPLIQGVLRYKAGTKTGQETISYNIAGQNKQLTIHIFDKKGNFGFVNDDQVFTSMGSTVEFDVFQNDLGQDLVLLSKSPELKLVAPNSGRLQYAPPVGFQGVKNFYYEVSDGISNRIGNIEIVVNDNIPQVLEYEFVTRENTPFVLDHKAAVEGSSINFSQAPQNGILRLQENGFFYCGGKVNGSNFLVYNPNDGFVGSDQFKVEYCTDAGSCVTLEVAIEIESSTNDCDCIGADCAWPGDADGDGVVSVRDLLPIGYHIGKKGPERSEKGNTWNALQSENWKNENEEGVNLKNVDSNGDGIIDVKDVDGLNANFSKLNSLISADAISIKEVPFYAVPSERSGQEGDLISIDLFLGTADQPLLQSNGLAFNFNIPPSYIEDGSLHFDFNSAAWFGYNNPTLETVQYPRTGRVEGAISRTGDAPIDGFGHVGTFQIVLQEDYDGFKPESGKLPIDIVINGGEVMSGSGSKYGLQDAKTTIYLELDQQNIQQEIEIITYPNPTSDLLTIHANNGDEIHNIYLFNTLGQSINNYTNIASNHFEMNTSQLPEGFYMARVETKLGVSVEKVQIVRE